MKRFFILAALFFITGMGLATAQDILTMRNGTVINVKILEISTTEIKYKRYDNLDGPLIVIPRINVSHIRYENGVTENITRGKTAIDPNKLIFGINMSPFCFYSGPWGGFHTIGFEFGYKMFNFELDFSFLSLSIAENYSGFGGLAMFNFFLHSRNGGFYLGLGGGWTHSVDNNGEHLIPRTSDEGKIYSSLEIEYRRDDTLTFGFNMGYKFVTKTGIYFRTGSFIGIAFGFYYIYRPQYDLWNSSRENGNYYSVYFKPDLLIGWTMR